MNAIKDIRTRLGFTQQALADAIGCSQGNVSFYEKGQEMPPPTARKLIEVAAAKGVAVTFDEIYGAPTVPTPEKVA